jgi:methylated-DNA-[protein]-cysteine S-methyltransferase
VLSRSSISTPIGTLHLIAHDNLLLASGFGDYAELESRLDSEDQIKRTSRLPIVTDLLEDYLDGDLAAINGISVRQDGENFSQASWRAMRKVAAGKTISYADLAKRAGSPEAVRAAGSACARNLIALVVPCHRIVKSGGQLGNYAYGLKAKEWLLRHENAIK